MYFMKVLTVAELLFLDVLSKSLASRGALDLININHMWQEQALVNIKVYAIPISLGYEDSKNWRFDSAVDLPRLLTETEVSSADVARTKSDKRTDETTGNSDSGPGDFAEQVAKTLVITKIYAIVNAVKSITDMFG